MSLAQLFDHGIRVWRSPELSAALVAGPLGEESRTYVLVTAAPAGFNACVNRPRAPVADAGPGFAPIGTRIVYMTASADVQLRDLLELVTGPDAPEVVEVDEPPTRPRGHHLELSCIPWHGTLP